MSSPNDQPIGFAILRNSHESMRSAINDMTTSLQSDEDLAKFSDLWKAYRASLAVHLMMEEEGMEPFMDRLFDGVSSKSVIPELHKKDKVLALHVEEALQKKDRAATLQAYEAWRQVHEDHMLQEEKVWMPLVPKTAPTPQERNLLVHTEIFMPVYLKDPKAMESFLAWCVYYLSRYGSTSNTPLVATTVFVRGARCLCYQTQWKELVPAMKSSCLPEIWEEMQSVHEIELVRDDSHLPNPVVSAPTPTSAVAVPPSNSVVVEPKIWPTSDPTVPTPQAATESSTKHQCCIVC